MGECVEQVDDSVDSSVTGDGWSVAYLGGSGYGGVLIPASRLHPSSPCLHASLVSHELQVIA